jgi:hypothetical protein
MFDTLHEENECGVGLSGWQHVISLLTLMKFLCQLIKVVIILCLIPLQFIGLSTSHKISIEVISPSFMRHIINLEFFLERGFEEAAEF